MALGLLVAWTLVSVLAGLGLDGLLPFKDKGSWWRLFAELFTGIVWAGGLWVGMNCGPLRDWIEKLDRRGR